MTPSELFLVYRVYISGLFVGRCCLRRKASAGHRHVSKEVCSTIVGVWNGKMRDCSLIKKALLFEWHWIMILKRMLIFRTRQEGAGVGISHG